VNKNAKKTFLRCIYVFTYLESQFSCHKSSRSVFAEARVCTPPPAATCIYEKTARSNPGSVCAAGTYYVLVRMTYSVVGVAELFYRHIPAATKTSTTSMCITRGAAFQAVILYTEHRQIESNSCMPRIWHSFTYVNDPKRCAAAAFINFLFYFMSTCSRVFTLAASGGKA